MINKFKTHLFLLFLLSIFVHTSQAQVVNKGATINITDGAAFKATDINIVNSTNGNINNNGTISTTRDFINEADANLSGDGSYEVAGSWMNEGSYDAGTSTVTIGGTSNCAIFSGASSFYDLVIDCQSGGTIGIEEPLYLSNSVRFATDNNYIQLNTSDFTIGPNATIIDASANRNFIINGSGYLIKEDLATFTFPIRAGFFSYHPITITQNGAIDDIEVGIKSPYIETPGPSNRIDADWYISETIEGDSDLDITLQWDEVNEPEDFDRSNCGIAQVDHTQNDPTTFISGTGMATGNNPYQQTATGITDLSLPFTVESAASLPLELLSFEAQASQNRHSLLTWQTTSENQVSHFEIERRTDAKDWIFVNKVNVIGFSQQITKYDYMDKDVHEPYSNVRLFYYRLKMVDDDGSFKYSDIQQVAFSAKDKMPDLTAFPNPFSENTTIQFYLPENGGKTELKITDALGRIVKNYPLSSIEEGQIQISANEMASGIYNYSLIQNGHILMTKKLIVMD